MLAVPFPGTHEKNTFAVRPGDHTYEFRPRVVRGVTVRVTGEQLGRRQPLAASVKTPLGACRQEDSGRFCWHWGLCCVRWHSLWRGGCCLLLCVELQL